MTKSRNEMHIEEKNHLTMNDLSWRRIQ